MLANSGQMWFYHAPSKRHDEQDKQFAPAASQIPGLAALDPLDQEAWEREVGVKKQKQAKETDSHYIRLAKQGGRKNLLAFSRTKEPDETQPQPYPRVDWFDHHDCDPDKDKEILSHAVWQPPEYMIHEYEGDQEETRPDSELADKAKPKRAPFYTDNMSVWARGEGENLKNKKSKRRYKTLNHKYPKLPEVASQTQMSRQFTFSKLIGGEYGNEWYRNQAEKGPAKVKHTETKQDKGYLNLTEYQQSICRKVIPPKKLKPIVFTQGKGPTEKPTEKRMFKLSKFSNVPSKLKTGAD